MTPLVVGKPEIAELLGVGRTTPAQWATRELLPDPDHPPVNGRPTWFLGTILEWAKETDRLPEADVIDPPCPGQLLPKGWRGTAGEEPC